MGPHMLRLDRKAVLYDSLTPVHIRAGCTTSSRPTIALAELHLNMSSTWGVDPVGKA